ncbi:hypothetical protein [Streptomyces sp. NPDC091268]|uniref:hypothetical protein n=1 Tax=Streptomyces sp. NPDC091268 TaxID=3365979 RepID=UPI0037F9A4E8
MTESEKTNNSQSTSRSSSNGTKSRSRAASAARDGAKAAAGTASDTASGTVGALSVLPAPLAEKTVAAAKAISGTVGSTVGRAGWVWTAVRARKAITVGAASATAAVVSTAYTLGRRSGLRQRGPLSRLTGGRL